MYPYDPKSHRDIPNKYPRDIRCIWGWLRVPHPKGKIPTIFPQKDQSNGDFASSVVAATSTAVGYASSGALGLAQGAAGVALNAASQVQWAKKWALKWFQHMGVEPKIGVDLPPKMDSFFIMENKTPYFSMDDLGGKNPLFLVQHPYSNQTISKMIQLTPTFRRNPSIWRFKASVSLVASATGAAISYTGHRVWSLGWYIKRLVKRPVAMWFDRGYPLVI